MISIYLLFPLFLVLLLLPFLPGIIELIKPRDSEPLFIRMDYSKDPRYFGSTFKDLLKNSLKEDSGIGIKNIKLSKDEKVEVMSSANIVSGKQISDILYASGNILSGNDVSFEKEIYATGEAVIGKKNIVRAIASDSSIKLSEEVRVIRWLDAESSITADKSCDLGISASCNADIKLGVQNTFKRLWGNPVTTSSLSGDVIADDKTQYSDKKNFEVIPHFTKVQETLIVGKNLEIGEGCTLMGSVKIYGDLIVGKNTKIYGNVFSEGNIEIGEGSEISGNVFSQGTIKLKNGVKVGRPDVVKSVIGKKGVLLGRDVRIFRYVMTEGRGLTI